MEVREKKELVKYRPREGKNIRCFGEIVVRVEDAYLGTEGVVG